MCGRENRWDEFVNHVIMSVKMMQDHDPRSIEKGKPYSHAATVSVSHHGKTERISILHDLSPENGSTVAVMESGEHSLKLLHPQDAVQDPSSFPGAVRVKNCHNGEILATKHLIDLNFIVTASSDSTVCFFDALDLSFRQRLPLSEIPVALEWHPATGGFTGTAVDSFQGNNHAGTGTLFIATMNGSLFGYDPLTLDCTVRVDSSTPGHHTKACLDILVVRSSDLLVTAGLDHKIGVWSPSTGEPKGTLLGHCKGVFSLAYSEEHRILVSAGYEHEVYVWNLHVGTFTCRLSGHNAPLIAVRLASHSPQLISASWDGVIKVWDLRNFECMQTIYCEGHGTSGDHASGGQRIADMEFFDTSDYGRILIAAGSRLFIYETAHPKRNDVADSQPTFDVRFHSATSTFVTTADHAVCAWDVRTGHLVRKVEPRTPNSDITAMCFDDTLKQLVTGDSTGNVTSWLFATGERIQRVCTHSSAVSALAFELGSDIVISAGWDGFIKLHKLDSAVHGVSQLLMALSHSGSVAGILHKRPLVTDSRASLQQPDNQTRTSSLEYAEHRQTGTDLPLPANKCKSDQPIVRMAYDAFLGQLATAADDASVCVWDLRYALSTRAVGACIGHKHEISALVFLAPYPALITADTSGKICAWSVYPATNPFRCLFTFSNEVKHTSVAVLSVAWDVQTRTLYVGDALGVVSRWDLTRSLCDVDIHMMNSSLKRGNHEVSYRQPTEPQVEVPSSSSSSSLGDSSRPSRTFITRQASHDGESSDEDETKTSATSTTPKNDPSKIARIGVQPFRSLRWQAHRASVTAMRIISADGLTVPSAVDNAHTVLATSSIDGTVKFWDVNGRFCGALNRGLGSEEAMSSTRLHWSLTFRRSTAHNANDREEAEAMLFGRRARATARNDSDNESESSRFAGDAEDLPEFDDYEVPAQLRFETVENSIITAGRAAVIPAWDTVTASGAVIDPVTGHEKQFVTRRRGEPITSTEEEGILWQTEKTPVKFDRWKKIYLGRRASVRLVISGKMNDNGDDEEGSEGSKANAQEYIDGGGPKSDESSKSSDGASTSSDSYRKLRSLASYNKFQSPASHRMTAAPGGLSQPRDTTAVKPKPVLSRGKSGNSSSFEGAKFRIPDPSSRRILRQGSSRSPGGNASTTGRDGAAGGISLAASCVSAVGCVDEGSAVSERST